jgi:hypothetical protein
MKISDDMPIYELMERMGHEASEAEAEYMRRMLVEYYDGCDTEDIMPDRWRQMLRDSVLLVMADEFEEETGIDVCDIDPDTMEIRESDDA